MSNYLNTLHLSKTRLKEIADLHLYPAPAESQHIAECGECITQIVKTIMHKEKLEESGNNT
jgi:hypothetical protein